MAIKKDKIDLLLNILIIILLLVCLIVFWVTPKDDCEACKYRVDGKSFNIKNFMSDYSSKCLNKLNPLKVNISDLNLEK